MKGIKRSIAALLAAASASAVLPVFASVLPEDVKGTRYEEPIQVLSALGIMIGDAESGLYRPDDTIIRSEVAKMAVHAMGLEDVAKSSSQSTKFPDVVENHWATGYINVATAQGIIIGDDNGNFRPDDKITYAEAMTIMVRALGFEPMADSKGGFPSGYIVLGSENGLNKNVTGTANEPISRGNVAYMTYNALTANLMEQKGFGSNLSYEVGDKTLLKDRLDVTKGEGQVTAIENSSLTGSSTLTDGQVQIGKDIYDASYNMNNLLGYNVVYYVKENNNGDSEVILALPKDGHNSTVEVSADLFDAVTEKNGNKAISYFKNENTSKTTTAEFNKDAILVYNGKNEEMSDELLNIKDKAGKIVLLDTDKDGKYNIAFVTEYTNMVVEEVTSSNRVVDKYGAPSLKLDKDDSSIDFRITKGLNEIDVQDLQEYDVLSIAASLDKELYDITVTSKSVTGKVTEFDDDGVYINGDHYKIASNYTQSIQMNDEGTFYLDIEDKIAAVDNSETASSNYAYLVRAHVSTDKEVANFKLFTKAGKEVVLEATDKIRFNGKSGQKSENVVAELLDGKTTVDKQLVTYEVNSDGKLVTLNTAVDNTATGAVNDKKFTKNYVLSNAEYNAKQNKLGKVIIDDSTVIFDIPSDAVGTSDYSIANKSMFEDGSKYDVIVFDRTDDFIAKAIIVTNANFTTNADSSIAVVTKVSSTTNKDDVETDKLYAFVDGKEININAEEKGILVKDGKTLENGDIIQYKTNANGEIANIRVLFDISKKADEFTLTPVENLDLVYGKVTQKFSSSMNVQVADGEIVNYVLGKDVVVYTVDTKKSKNNVTVGTIGEIQKYDAEEGNRVFVKIYKDEVQEVVIVK